jgi:hypothetical protein
LFFTVAVQLSSIWRTAGTASAKPVHPKKIHCLNQRLRHQNWFKSLILRDIKQSFLNRMNGWQARIAVLKTTVPQRSAPIAPLRRTKVVTVADLLPISLTRFTLYEINCAVCKILQEVRYLCEILATQFAKRDPGGPHGLIPPRRAPQQPVISGRQWPGLDCR